jgi:hypothetical protein
LKGPLLGEEYGMKRIVVVACVVVSLIAGCRGKAPPPPIVVVEGIVRLDGKPLNRAQVRFIPLIDYGAEYVAVGVTDETGRFKLTCKGQPGACAGENRVLVVESDIPKELQSENAQLELARYLRSLGGRPIPEKYGDLTQSDLTVTVKPDQPEITLNLVR